MFAMYNPHPQHIPDRFTKYQLLRVFNKECYRDSFLNGYIRMLTPDGYRRPETHNSSTYDVRVDSAEGSIINYAYTDIAKETVTLHIDENGECWYIAQPIGQECINGAQVLSLISYYDKREYTNISCYYSIWIDEKKHELLPIDKSTVKDFGDYGALIMDRDLFLSIIDKSLDEYGGITKKYIGFPNYVLPDGSVSDGGWHPYKKTMNDYIKQNEFRIFIEKEVPGLLELKVDPLTRNIVIPVYIPKFLETIYTKDGLLWFVP